MSGVWLLFSLTSREDPFNLSQRRREFSWRAWRGLARDMIGI